MGPRQRLLVLQTFATNKENWLKTSKSGKFENRFQKKCTNEIEFFKNFGSELVPFQRVLFLAGCLKKTLHALTKAVHCSLLINWGKRSPASRLLLGVSPPPTLFAPRMRHGPPANAATPQLQVRRGDGARLLCKPSLGAQSGGGPSVLPGVY